MKIKLAKMGVMETHGVSIMSNVDEYELAKEAYIQGSWKTL